MKDQNSGKNIHVSASQPGNGSEPGSAEDERQPLLDSILENLDDSGSLPENYHLPKKETAEEMRFLDGALDGVQLYHQPARETDLRPYSEAIYRILSGHPVEAEQRLLKAFQEDGYPGMTNVSGSLQLWMNEHREAMESEEILKFAVTELMSAQNRELVKFCLTLLSFYHVDPNGQIARLIRIFSLSDEFTFYCVTMMKDWPNGNDEVFETAKRTHGWGRIHAVHYLEADTMKIRDWMLTEGWKNRVSNSYNAREIAIRLPLTDVLYRSRLTDEELKGVCGIMDALMDESHVPGISSLREKVLLMNAFLKQTRGRMLTRDGVDAVQKVRRYQEEHPDTGSAAPDL